MMKEKIFYYLPSIIFNIAEFLVVILIGVLLKIKIINIIFLILLFATARMLFKGAMHYKDWKECLLWTTMQVSSLFLASKVGTLMSIITTVFAAAILSGKGNIKDIFMWESRNALNKEVFNWVKFNQDNPKLKAYEDKLKETDKKKYYIFKYRFREFKSYSQIDKIMDLGRTPRVAEELNIISHFIEYSIRLD